MSSLLVFSRVYSLEIQSIMLIFSTPLLNMRPSNLLTGSPTPPPPNLPCVNKYRGTCSHAVCDRGGLMQITKHLPPSTFSEKPAFRVWCLYRYLVHGVKSPKFIWDPCAQLYSLADTPVTFPPPPRIWAHIRGFYWSAKIDDISL